MLQCDTWFFRGQQSRLVKAGNPAPEGWTDEPEVPFAAEGEYDYVIEEKHTPRGLPSGQGPFRSDGSGFKDIALLKTEEVKRGPGRPPKVPAAEAPQGQE